MTIITSQLRILAQTENNNTNNIIAVVFTLLLATVAFLWYYDRKYGYRYSRALRGMIGDWIIKIRNKKKYSNELSERIDL